MSSRRIYLDHNATTPLHPAVLDAMLPYFCDEFGNASSVHWFGQQARRAVDAARRQVATLIGANEGEVFFVSGGTEANNLALRGVLDASRRKGEGVPHLVISAVEHPAVLETSCGLQRRGIDVSRLPVDGNGRVEISTLGSAIDSRTALLSVMYANNDVGTIQPVAEIGAIARELGVPMHTDAVQAVGKLPIDVRALGVDLLSISAHKIYGPKGVGALYVRRGVELSAQLTGGEQEMRRRAGTENVPAIVGFGKACEIAAKDLDGVAARVTALRDRLEAGILERVSDVEVNCDVGPRLGNTLSATIAGVTASDLVMNLDLQGIATSVGAACASGKVEPSHVLRAMGRTSQQALGTIRLSLGRDNTAEDVATVVEALAGIVPRLRGVR